MSKELEALKFIKNVEVEIGNDLNTATKVFELDHEYDKAFEIVEKGLKELNDIKSGKIRLSVNSGENYVAIPKYQYEKDLKKLKALEIIKTVCPNIFWVMRTYTYKEYKKKCTDDTLLQEEYDLLREVLL